MFISKTKIKFYKKNGFFTANEFWFCCRQPLNIIIYTCSWTYTLQKLKKKKPVFDMFFFYCPSMAYKEILSQDVKTFSRIKEGNVNCPLLIDPRKGRAFCKVSIGHIFFLFLLGKNRHKMYLRHILCIKDIFNFEYFLLSVCLWWRGWDQISQTTRCSM